MPPVDRLSATGRSAEVSESIDSTWQYVWFGIVGHLIWGSYPVFGKRAVAEIPKFSLLLIASGAGVLVAVGLITWRDEWSWRDTLRHLLTSPILWVLAIFIVARSVTNIVSIELTRATWVQLINILTPFPVAFLGVWFFHQPVPRYTYRALTLSTVGAAMMLVPDWSEVAAGFTVRDALGLATAVFSTITLAAYFQLVRRSRLQEATDGLIMLQQSLALVVAYTVLTLLANEKWAAWYSLTTAGWFAALWVIGVVMVAGSLLLIVAVGSVSPARVTNFMALRLVSAFILGWIVLGERLVTPTQWLGAGLVVVTVTLYLWLQSVEARNRRDT